MSPVMILLITVLLIILIGGVPAFGLHNYGNYPSSIAGILLLVVLILLLTGRL